MRKIYLLLSFVLIIYQQAYSQLEIDGPKVVCPGEAITYNTVLPTSQNCQLRWTVTNGVFAANGNSVLEGPAALLQNVDVIWNNVVATSSSSAPTGTIGVERYSCVINDGDHLSHTINNIVILTLNNITPGNISGPQSVNRGSSSNVSYSIPQVAFPNTGTLPGGPATMYADSYQWILPSGWTIGSTTSDGTTPITGQSHSITATPHSCNGRLGLLNDVAIPTLVPVKLT